MDVKSVKRIINKLNVISGIIFVVVLVSSNVGHAKYNEKKCTKAVEVFIKALTKDLNTSKWYIGRLKYITKNARKLRKKNEGIYGFLKGSVSDHVIDSSEAQQISVDESYQNEFIDLIREFQGDTKMTLKSMNKTSNLYRKMLKVCD